jgi:hypothetical protein
VSGRVEQSIARLRKGMEKTAAVFGALGAPQWNAVLYEGPPRWTVRDLLAHFLSAEEALLLLAQDVAGGGPGAPPGFDYHAFNAAEQERLAGISPQQLLADLAVARQRTIAWAERLQDADLDRMGGHPAMGEVTVEVFLNAMYGHQLLHVREMLQVLGADL